MDGTSEQTTITRILVALDTSEESLRALETAAALAARTQAELVGLFIEDEDLIHLAGLPFAREVDGASAVARQLDGLRVARRLRAQAEQVRKLLDQTAARRQVQASLQVIRGRYVPAALTAAAAMDVLFLGRLSRTAWLSASVRPRRRTAETASAKRSVWVLYDGSPVAARCVAIAGELSRFGGGQLVILVPEAVAGKTEKLKEQIGRLLGEPHLAARFVTIPAADAVSLHRAMHRERCGLLVLQRDSAVLRDSAAQEWLEKLECPVALVP